MKKIIFTLLLLAVIFLPFSNTYALEKYGVDIKLIEPEKQIANIGDVLEYRVDIRFTENLAKYQNLFITLELDKALEYEDSQILGVEPVAGALEAFSKVNSQGRRRFLTIRVTNTAALNGSTDFSVRTLLRVTDQAQIGQRLTNTVVAASQKTGQVNQSDYFEFEQRSNFLIGKEGAGNQDNNPSQEIKDPFLKIKTSPIYGSFMREIEGYTNPQALIRVNFPDGQKDYKVDSSGKFLISLDKNYNQAITISSIQGGAILQSQTLNFVDESTMTEEYLQAVIKSMREFGHQELIDGMVADFKAYTDRTSLIFGLEGGTYQEKYQLFQRLYMATRPINSGERGRHQSFMQGYPDGSFLPANGIKRSETAAILSRLIAGGEVSERNSSFPDVPSYEWYNKYIAHMEEIGLMKGYEEDGTFKPDRKISRAEFASIVARYLNLPSGPRPAFPDIPSDHWALEDIGKVVKAGIMQGYPEGIFDPQRPVTRAEAATIINRMLDRQPDEAFIRQNNIRGFSDIVDHWSYYQVVEATYDHDYVKENGQEKYK
ncbi:MAG: S-layer homology domain-containing protein [Bacillota bacterium]|nr:S-layer homology domain-containing protein [Bacillota bacterium]